MLSRSNITYSLLFYFVTLASTTGCISKKSAAPSIVGQVVDEDENGLPGVVVTANGNDHTVSDSAGHYLLSGAGIGVDEFVVVTFRCSGKASLSRALGRFTENLVVPVTRMRAVDQITPISLPTGTAEALQVNLTRADAGVALGISPDSFVHADGSPAFGDANVSLTYWHPLGTLESAPALLMASNANSTPLLLETFGMADVEVSQNGEVLQVAAGATVLLQFTVPPAKAATLVAASVMPSLYYMDPNTALWIKETSLGDTNFTYDANARLFSAYVPHLTAWNIDGELPPTSGGCVQGKIINACSPLTPYSGPLKIWFLGVEQLKDWSGTAADGQYCVNTAVSPYYAPPQGDPTNQADYPVNYLIGTGDLSTVSGCDPLPGECQTCNPAYESRGDLSMCNTCQILIPGVANFTDPTVSPPLRYADTCVPATPTANIHACAFCPGTYLGDCTMPNTPSSNGLVADGTVTQNCAVLNTVVLRPPGCQCRDPGTICSTSMPCCANAAGAFGVCNAAGLCTSCTKQLGQACSISDGCCDAAGNPLTCADNVCVPLDDPTYPGD